MGNRKRNKPFDLRKGVDFIGVTCVFFCHDGKGRLLMHKRSKHCRDEIGRWDCGSESMEFGERSFAETVRRGVREEYNVNPSKIRLCGVTNVLRKHNGRKTHWIAFLFAAKVDPRKVKIGEPHKMEELCWFSLNKLPRPLHSRLRRHLNMVRRAAGI